MGNSKLPLVFGVFFLMLLAGAAGYLLSQNKDSLFHGGADDGEASQSGEEQDLRSLNTLRKENKELKAKLAELKTRAQGVQKKGGEEKISPFPPDKDFTEKEAWARKKGKGKDGKGWSGKKGKQDWKPGLPKGMTEEQQDARVREIVDGHDWAKTANALATWGRADRGGRGVSLPDKEALGDFFQALGELRDVGVDFFDRRVARRFVPAMVSNLGADLDQGQADQITSFVDETAQAEENQPDPDPPLRYAQQKARDLQVTLDLEARMETILRPEQFAEYLSEVGDDPFQSGFGFKTQRMACTGATADAVATRVADLWGGDWYGLQAHRTHMDPVARQFVSQVLALPAPSEGLTPAARRRAILERTQRALELQGGAEQELLRTLNLSEEERSAFLGGRWPVLDLVIE